MNAVESRRAARCANAVRLSDPLPPKSRETLEAFENQVEPLTQISLWMMRVIDGFKDDDRAGLYIYGNPGVGKSIIAAHAARGLRELDRPVLYVMAKRMLDELRSRDYENVRDWRERLSRADVLVLDDLGAHRTTDYAIEELVTAIHWRHDLRLPTLITSNLTGEQLVDAMGERLADRVRGLCQPLHVEGESHR